MTTPEHKAAEYATKVANGCSPDQLRHICERTMRHFLAGHAAGKQEAEQRIWAKFVSWMTGPPDDRRLRIVSDELKRIIFGDEKV